ncbi:hypothetical protein XELAEV_18030103mg [Xenopus laevis]|uniref:Uncharacterized protein n=1 Tax=Xenopus laevis TaxID=8355 RepID=A0A974HIF9_XENLA|nr:hypothetical protein XELAEV_18030103mg [Xenopus laevis]
MDPKKPTSSPLGKRKGESVTAALNAAALYAYRKALEKALGIRNALEKALGFSSNSSSVGAPVGANSGIVPGQSASTNLASSSTAGPSTTSSVRKRVHSAEDQTSSNKHHRIDKDDKTSSTVPYITSWSPVSQQNASAQKPKRKYKKIKRRTRISTSAANTCVVTSQTGNIGGISLPGTDTKIMPNISYSMAQNGNSAQQHTSMNPNQSNLQNNSMVPQNPSTTTRGIYEYITLSDMERATRAHQQLVTLQQQMKYLRESPFSVQENSPLFRNPIPQKRKLDTNSEDAALWNPKRFRLRLGKGPKVHPKALERKADAQKIEGKEECASDDIFPPMIKSQQSEKKDDLPTN